MTADEKIRQELNQKWYDVLGWTKTGTRGMACTWDLIMQVWEKVRDVAGKTPVYTFFWHDVRDDMDMAFNYMPTILAKDHAIETLWRAVNTIKEFRNQNPEPPNHKP